MIITQDKTSPIKKHIRYLGSTHCLDLDEHVQESYADFLRVVMKAVFESGQEFFQYWMAEAVVQDNSQTLGKTLHKPQVIRYPVYCLPILSAVTIRLTIWHHKIAGQECLITVISNITSLNTASLLNILDKICRHFTGQYTSEQRETAFPTLKTEQRTSGELMSAASSISFFRKSVMIVGGRSSQHLARILQTPRVALERTVG